MAEKKLRDQLPEGIRMKGGVASSPGGAGFVAIVHSWDNLHCLGEPKEWMSSKVFPTEGAAMRYYKKSVRPALKKVMREAQRAKAMKVLHREIE